MPKTFSEQEIEAQYQKLPKVLQDAMYDPDIADKILGLGKEYDLTLDKVGFLADEVGYVILGLRRTGEFSPALAERLQIPPERSSALAQKASQRIFYPLREALKSTHQMEVNEGVLAAARPVAMPPLPQRPVPPKPERLEEPLLSNIAKKPSLSPLTAAGTVTPSPEPAENRFRPSPLSTEGKPKIPPIDLRQVIRPQQPKESLPIQETRPPREPVTVRSTSGKEEIKTPEAKPPIAKPPAIRRPAPKAASRIERLPGGGTFAPALDEPAPKSPVGGAGIRETRETASAFRPPPQPAGQDPYREPME